MRYFGAILFIVFIGCNNRDYLYRIKDDTKFSCGYLNAKGDTIIPSGRYDVCWTDTLKTYAIVSKAKEGLVAIDKTGKELYQVFNFDNGPDYPVEGYFRIIQKANLVMPILME